MRRAIASVGFLLAVIGCTGPQGEPGPPGPAGSAGANGADGSAGVNGDGGTSAIPEAPTSGTRIVVSTTTTTTASPDGARRVQTLFGWYDSQRNEACGPTMASDGKYRCLPPGTFPTSYFSDSGCTQPIVGVSKGGCGAPAAAPKYGVVSATVKPGCFANKLVAITGPLQGDSAFTGNPASCSPTTIVTNVRDGNDLYTTGAEIAPTEFAEMTVTTTTSP